MIEEYDPVKHFPMTGDIKWVIRNEWKDAVFGYGVYDFFEYFTGFRKEIKPRRAQLYGYWVATEEFEDAVLWMMKYVKTSR
jgi:hypothetical protein